MGVPGIHLALGARVVSRVSTPFRLSGNWVGAGVGEIILLTAPLSALAEVSFEHTSWTVLLFTV